MRYDRVLERQVRRALSNVEGDIEALVEQASDLGVSDERLAQMLMDDLENNGPIFGKFLNNMLGVAETTVVAAARQGSTVGQLVGSGAAVNDPEVSVLTDDDIDRFMNEGDPVAMEAYKDVLRDQVEFTWIAELVNTCQRCLPLHGSSALLSEWEARGLHPDSIHSGWNSACHCQLVRRDLAADRKDLMTPLVRNPVETKRGTKGNKRSKRSILQEDIERAQAAVAKTQESEEGRRTLRMLGQSNALTAEPVLHPKKEEQ